MSGYDEIPNLAVVAVALLVALSGCSALGGSQTADPATESDSEPVNETESEANGSDDTSDDIESNGTENDTDDGTENGTDDGDDTADAEWSPPEEPNRPIEDEREDRIESVEFVDKEPAASGDGYSNFNLEVVANTSMEDVDPPEHGDVEGEPYFFVKINEDEQKLIERTDEVRMEENGTFHIDVRPAGIEEFGAGSLAVEVFLMDEDKDWDDIYDSVGRDIQYNPDADDSSSIEDGSETSEN
ncbi:hypothetical protein [Natrinema longum]|uniref:Uncharacterized protein n=1 Tax=Natrinema longum TaxID=370324 RepID=A0A8A2UFW7_9EURY|nr:hypothetical protein [Natrinema longum]MBZ6495577.1 hypothetical protein [Natrinema longum]QSW86458.1 hypothetical protein J0X27_06480 [Natrinema longum]